MADPQAQKLQIALDEEAIRGSMRPESALRFGVIEVLDDVHSTNDYLLMHPFADIHGRVVLAERQAAGRGRRGRAWRSPRGNIFMSLGWRFDSSGEPLDTLSLVVGVCVCRALSRLGLTGHGVKWPNDVQVNGEKLAGILVDLKRRKSGICAVIGIGINVNLRHDLAAEIDQPPTDLASHPGVGTDDRNTIIAAVADELVAVLGEGALSLTDFLHEHWSDWDVLHKNTIRVEDNGRVFEGVAAGITQNGALRLVCGSGPDDIITFNNGEVSVRRA